MKKDKELVKLAAKAVGLKIHQKTPWKHYSDRYGYQWMNMDGSKVERSFNPLNDDGDALRLAVDLELLVDCQPTYVEAYSAKCKRLKAEPYNNDKHAATRRAIVRAAAAIGEGME